MKDNRDILNEAFFKKATYEEKRKASLPQYEPVDRKASKNGSGLVPTPGAFSVADNDELKRRLAGTFGVVFGGNNVKSVASKAIKEFPIIVSDSVEPETIIMLKKLMEEQYAEYINLLISNQVIDLSNYRANEGDGNIAIQALDSISGSDFGKRKLADKAARTGTISPDDVFSTIPLYTLLRENKLVINSGDKLTDSLLENAMIVPSEQADKLVEFVMNYSSDIAALNETSEVRYRNREDDTNSEEYYRINSARELSRDFNIDVKRGFAGQDSTGKDKFEKLTTADVVFDPKMLDHVINRSVGDLLTSKENVYIRDKFEKATYLLQSRRIAGREYYQYLTLRLGIPVSDSVRSELMRHYRVQDVRDYSSTGTSKNLLTKERQHNIAHSKEINGLTKKICNTKIITVLNALGFGVVGAIPGGIIGTAVNPGIRAALEAAANSGSSSSIGGSAAAISSTALASSAIIWAPLVGAAIGSGGYLLYKLIQHSIEEAKADAKKECLEGWERVERLIILMENRQAEVIEMGMRKDLNDAIRAKRMENERKRLENILQKENLLNGDRVENKRDIDAVLDDRINPDLSIRAWNDGIKAIGNSIRESIENPNTTTYANETFTFPTNGSTVGQLLESMTDEVFSDEHLRAEILAERSVKTNMPMQIKYVEKKPGSDVLYTPLNFTRSSYAYGSTEIERKDNKDRRYNQPLIMKVRFKERYDDGKYADNELTAVIGILGKVIRVPSSEMEYILSENCKGNTVDGVIQAAVNNDISALLGTSKIAEELKKLPKSGDIWHNLEKVATLAAANTITGRRNRNIANAHIVFSQKEIDSCRIENGVDYLKDIKKTVALMKRYSAFTLMVANDAGQRAYIFDDQDKISWDVLPYTALAGKDNGEQLAAALNKLGRL